MIENKRNHLNEILQDRPGPLWCKLMETACGEISNYHIRDYDYELAEKYQPDTLSFSQNDLLRCECVDDIPEDWLQYLYACIDKYEI